MNMIKLEDITPEDYRYIRLRTKLITPSDQARYIAELVYDDGIGVATILKRSISSSLDEAIEDAIYSSGMLFLLKEVK